MEKVSLDGKTYIKATKIARELGYTADYVGQLCRSKKVDAQLVGRSWFVEEDSIANHKENRYRSSKAQSKKHLKTVVKNSAQESQTTTHHFYEKADSSYAYENDETDLIPVPQKHTHERLSVELADAKKVDVRSEKTDYDFKTPKRSEIQFQGTLVVADFDESDETSQTADGATHIPVDGSKRKSTVKISVDTSKPKKSDANAVVVKKPSVQQLKRKPQVAVRGKKVKTPAVVQEVTPISSLTILSFTVSAFAIVLVLLGLETHVEAHNGMLIVEYTFSFDDILALAYSSQ